jgi:hypothetical protein
MSRIIAVNDKGRPLHLQKKVVIESEHQVRFDNFYYGEAFQCREMMDGRSIEIPGTRRTVIHPTTTNTILDNQLEYYGGSGPSQSFMSACHLGTSSQAESTADTALISWLAATNFETQVQDNYHYTSGSAPYWGARRRKARFEPNFGGGDVNINELGTCYTALQDGNTNGELDSRALTRDSNGDPTTVSVLSTEYLDVWYTRRIYPSYINETTGAPIDGTGSIDIDGITYNYTIRPGLLTNSTAWGGAIDDQFSPRKNSPSEFTCGTWYEHPATLGGVTSNPSTGGSNSSVDTSLVSLLAYAPFSYNRTGIYSAALDDANFASGIGGISFDSSMGTYQCILDAGVPKTSSLTFDWYCNFAWNRKVI